MKNRPESKEENGISRKKFIKRTAAGLIGLGVASSFPINYGYSEKGAARKLGRTGIRVRPVGFGATRSLENALLKIGLEKGINFIHRPGRGHQFLASRRHLEIFTHGQVREAPPVFGDKANPFPADLEGSQAIHPGAGKNDFTRLGRGQADDRPESRAMDARGDRIASSDAYAGDTTKDQRT